MTVTNRPWRDRFPPLPEAPPRPDWQEDAACAGAPRGHADALTEASVQTDGEALVQHWCARCPVMQECLEAGQALRGHGVWGGVVLAGGRPAPRRRREPAHG